MRHSFIADTLASTPSIQLSWLVKLRWRAVLGQMVTIAVVFLYLDVTVPLRPLALLIALTVATNLLVVWRLSLGEIASEAVISSILVLDTCVLTGLLYWSGGPTNPFSMLYLLHVTLAAVMLRPIWTWMVVALVMVSFGILYFMYVPLSKEFGHALRHDSSWYALHVQGMWVALVTAGVFIAYFITRVSVTLQRREAELAAARELTTRNERLVSLATLAAGAAHELGTPLATIAVTATELAHVLEYARLTNTSLHEDARLIRSQVERCRAIIEQIYIATAQTREEAFVSLRLDGLLQNLRQELGPVLATRVIMSNECHAPMLQCPRQALTHAHMSLLRNALDATPPEEAVSLTVKQQEGCIHFHVRDTGCGMMPDVLTRAGDPFYTTKAPGKGMGLGLFLVRNLAKRLGGRLELTSEPGKGTSAVLTLPLSSPRLEVLSSGAKS